MTQSGRSDHQRELPLFSLIAILILGLFVTFMGLIEVNPLTGGAGFLVVILAGHALFRLKAQK